MMVPWDVEFHAACEVWADELSQDDQEALLAAIKVLRRLGPQLGRPLVDSIRNSRYSNMKELRPPSTGASEVRVLFAFDPNRQAILLLGGDKSRAWAAWYRENLPIADARYEEHLASLASARTPGVKQGRQGQSKGKGRKS
jgi:hypothetical protein